MLDSRGKLHQFEKYVCNVFALPDLLESITDKRRAPEIPTFDVVNSLFHTAVLRIPSINALEGNLKESDFQKLIGRNPTQDIKAFSADVVANVLDKLHVGWRALRRRECHRKGGTEQGVSPGLLRRATLRGHRWLGAFCVL